MISDVGSGPEELEQFLTRCGLLSPGTAGRWTSLAGGVSSDVWRVDIPNGVLCVKQARARLKVAAEWLAPLSRSSNEWRYLQFAHRTLPGSVPRPLAHDAPLSVIVMEYLKPERYPVWKAELMAGRIEPSVAGMVGRMLLRLHASSAGDATLSREFDTLATFKALRLEPYLLALAPVHPDLADVLQECAQRTAGTCKALVHGDVSPKNILLGAAGPVLLDAECAWYGDPAFDVAFCLTHLLLKCLVRPGDLADLLKCIAAFVAEYLGGVSWEASNALEHRAASLLPALLLARVDGTSPVEYLGQQWQRRLVRQHARLLLERPVPSLVALSTSWANAVTTQARA